MAHLQKTVWPLSRGGFRGEPELARAQPRQGQGNGWVPELCTRWEQFESWPTSSGGGGEGKISLDTWTGGDVITETGNTVE